jgi:hypothetical protein
MASGLCFMHDPEHAKEAAEARELGGRRRKRESTISAAFDFEGLDDVPKLRRLLEIVGVDLLGLENSIPRGRAIISLVQAAAKLLEVGEHEERLETIEAVLAPRRQNGRGQQGRRGWRKRQ